MLLFRIITISVLLMTSLQAELRTWTSKAGSQVEAEVVSLEKDQLVLKTSEGRVIKMKLSALTAEDQAEARKEAFKRTPIVIVCDSIDGVADFGSDTNLVDALNLVSDYRFEPVDGGGGDPFTRKEDLDNRFAKEIEKVRATARSLYFLESDGFHFGGFDVPHHESISYLKENRERTRKLGIPHLLLMPIPVPSGGPGNQVEKSMERSEALAKKAKVIDGVRVLSVVPVIAELEKLSPSWKDNSLYRADEALIYTAMLHSFLTGEPANLAALYDSQLKIKLIHRNLSGKVAWLTMDEATLSKVAATVHKIVK